MVKQREKNSSEWAVLARRSANPRSWVATRVLLILAGLVAVLCGAPPAFTKGLEEASLLVTDEHAKKVFGYDADGRLLGSLNLSSANGRPSSIWIDGDTVYVLDSNKKRVYRYDIAGSLEAVSAELRRADGGGLSVPGGLAIDGDEMWIVDRGVARLSRYSLNDAFSNNRRLSANEEIPLSAANARAEGLAIDDVWLYVLDESDKQIYAYIRDYAGPVVASRVMRQADGSHLGAPVGLSIVGPDVLVVDRTRDKIFAYDLNALFFPGEPLPADGELELPPANRDARGLHHVREGAHQVADDAFVKEVVELINKERAKAKIEDVNKDREALNAQRKAEWEAATAKQQEAWEKENDERKKNHQPPLPAPKPLPEPVKLLPLTLKALPPLKEDELLQRAAKTHNHIMIRREKLIHQFDDEQPLLQQGPKNDRLDAVGYAATFAAENIGQEPTPAKMVEAWMKSLGHKVNILSEATEVGADFGTQPYGLAGDTRPKDYWTVVFANPAT